MRTVGIIGGLGPETTAEFYLDVVFACQQKNKTHRPAVIISSVPLPYIIEEDAITRNQGIERCLPYLIAEAKRLESSGADFLVMPCNSLHIYISHIRNAVSIPVLSIVEETVSFLKKTKAKHVGIISTSITVENKLYESAFTKAKIVYEAPNGLQQAKLGRIIHNLVTGQHNNKDREFIISVVDSFRKKDIDCVILACTDLQLLIPKHKELEVYDTMKILANATVERMLRKQRS